MSSVKEKLREALTERPCFALLSNGSLIISTETAVVTIYQEDVETLGDFLAMTEKLWKGDLI
jgi:hypothetical protein